MVSRNLKSIGDGAHGCDLLQHSHCQQSTSDLRKMLAGETKGRFTMGKNARKKLLATAKVAEFAKQGIRITQKDALRMEALSNERAHRQFLAEKKPVRTVSRVGYDSRIYQHRKGLRNRGLTDTEIDNPASQLYREVCGRVNRLQAERQRLQSKVDSAATELVRLHDLHSTSDFMVNRQGRWQIAKYQVAVENLDRSTRPERRTAIVNRLAVAKLNAGDKGYAKELRKVIKEVKSSTD